MLSAYKSCYEERNTFQQEMKEELTVMKAHFIIVSWRFRRSSAIVAVNLDIVPLQLVPEDHLKDDRKCYEKYIYILWLRPPTCFAPLIHLSGSPSHHTGGTAGASGRSPVVPVTRHRYPVMYMFGIPQPFAT